MAKGEKILVVGADPKLHGFFERNFSGKGYQLVGTRNYNGQLEAVLEEELPDIIVLDVMMPAMDGIGISLRIRQLWSTPILMLSTWGAEPGKIRRLDLNAEDYLTEPFGALELMAQIEDTLRRNGAFVEV